MGRTVVVIEDEAAIASAVAARLRSEGFEVSVAHDGEKGVRLCRDLDPDLVVLDLMLPGLNGLEVCRQIQRDRHVPVLMLTALGDVVVDPATRRVRRGEEEVHLTPTEFDLLIRLSTAKGAVLSREQLLGDVWGYRDGSGLRTVDSHVRSIRRKLGDGIIRTVHGVGYAIGDGP
jgi:DNA-binding response OmpR family regulator